jgi:Kef-type K+ transport system membrane component KefB
MLFFTIGIAAILYIGYLNTSSLSTDTSFQFVTADGIFNDFKNLLVKQFHHPLALLLTQIIIIMIATRFFGLVATKILLPIVVGEIAAGILLGPSFLGSLFPDFSAALFPTNSLGNLSMISQIGLIFFMFVIGMELDWESLKNQTKASVVISHSSIVFPFFLGVATALFLYDTLAPKETSFIPFALFIGIAMSITAFPVLARIVKERKISNTSYGAMALTCAAADDATAWYILAVIIAIASST